MTPEQETSIRLIRNYFRDDEARCAAQDDDCIAQLLFIVEDLDERASKAEYDLAVMMAGRWAEYARAFLYGALVAAGIVAVAHTLYRLAQ